MATKKSGKSSKTAHVLNVLSGPNQDQAAEDAVTEETMETEAETAASIPEATVGRPVRPPVLEVERASDDALAEQIRGSLEQDLAAEMEEDEPLTEHTEAGAVIETPGEPDEEAREAALSVPAAPPEDPDPEESASAPSEVPEEPPEAIEDTTETGSRAVEEMALPQPAAPQRKPAPTPSSSHPDEEINYVNVMQALVEEKTPKYLKMFEVCGCSRCAADVKALALSNLPSKYSVMKHGEVIPMLTVYEGRYSSALTAQIIRACQIVVDHPRHDD